MSADWIKKLDFFPKVSEAVTVRQTAQGGVIFTVFFFIMASLCVIEISSLISGDPLTEPYIDIPDLNDKTRVNLNISMFDLPCEAVTLDYQDITGTHFENMEQTMYKLDLDEKGVIIDYKNLMLVKKFESKNFYPSHPVWEHLSLSEDSTSCYGAELYEGQKCESCQDVQKAYVQRGWPVPPLEAVSQCRKKRVLAEEIIESPNVNSTDFIIKKSGVSFKNSEYIVQGLKENTVFGLVLTRSECFVPEEVQIEFEYIEKASGANISVPAKKIFFRIGECQKSLPLKVISVSSDNTEISLESQLLDHPINVLIEEGKFIIAKLSNKLDERASVSIEQIKSPNQRILHAEYYGFDDRQPTIITAQEIEMFRGLVGRGCQISGTMFINQVPGNFHISTHHKGLALKYVEKDITARHTVHFLEFTRAEEPVTQGSLGSKIKTNFINNFNLDPPTSHDVEYYLKIVGSKLVHSVWGEREFFEYVAHVNVVPKERNVVLVEFKYDFDPVSMKYTDGRETLSKFVISLLAIIGGIYATSTLVDRIFGG